MGETSNISQMANIVSKDIFDFFKWVRVGPPDTNFECIHLDDHFPAKSEQAKDDENIKRKTHPTDVVFYYQDPYTGFDVYVNTDLKSYAANSINSNGVRKWLNSLGKTIQCAINSPDWRGRFCTEGTDNIKVIGMLFIYNHDGNYTKNFYDYFSRNKNKAIGNVSKTTEKHIRPESIYIAPGQTCAIFDPALVQRLYNIVTDVKFLRSDFLFPIHKGYKFSYPSQIMHRARMEEFDCPATIEALTDPYLIIWHDPVRFGEELKCHEGYLVYYNRINPTYRDFIYLLDKLAQFQMFEGDFNIRIRCQPDVVQDYYSIFQKALSEFSSIWGFDDYKKAKFSNLEISRIKHVPTKLIEQEVGRGK